MPTRGLMRNMPASCAARFPGGIERGRSVDDAVPGQGDGEKPMAKDDTRSTLLLCPKRAREAWRQWAGTRSSSTTSNCPIHDVQAAWWWRAMVPLKKRQRLWQFTLARQRECRGGHRLADTSFLQPSGCKALVLDGTKRLQDMFLRKTVTERPTSRWGDHPWACPSSDPVQISDVFVHIPWSQDLHACKTVLLSPFSTLRHGLQCNDTLRFACTVYFEGHAELWVYYQMVGTSELRWNNNNENTWNCGNGAKVPLSSWQPLPSTSAPKRKPTEPPEDTPVDVESLDTPAPSTSCVHESVHPVQFGIMPKRLHQPHLDDEILSGHEEDVSSIQDGCTAWWWLIQSQYWNDTLSVKVVLCPSIVTPMTGGRVHPIQSIALSTMCPTICLSRHASAFWTGTLELDEAKKAPSKRTSRRNGTSLLCRRQLSTFSTNAWRVIFTWLTTPDALFFSTKDTFHPDIKVSSIYLHDTKNVQHQVINEGQSGWVLQAVISRASFRRLPRNGKSFFTMMSLHINHFVKKRCLGKKLLLTVCAVMLQEHVDPWLHATSPAACQSGSASTHHIIEEAFVNTDWPVPPGPTPLWRPGGGWSDVCGFLNTTEVLTQNGKSACAFTILWQHAGSQGKGSQLPPRSSGPPLSRQCSVGWPCDTGKISKIKQEFRHTTTARKKGGLVQQRPLARGTGHPCDLLCFHKQWSHVLKCTVNVKILTKWPDEKRAATSLPSLFSLMSWSTWNLRWNKILIHVDSTCESCTWAPDYGPK